MKLPKAEPINYKEQRRKALVKKYGEPETLEQLFHLLRQAVEDSTRTSPYVVGLAWSVSHRDRVSNTHYAPHNGMTNWGCKEDKPRGYPGYTGRIWIRFSRRPNSFGSDSLNQTLTYPGTGGGGSYDGPWANICSERFRKYGHKSVKDAYPEITCYSWDFRFFDADWPAITDTWIKHNLLNVIKTNKADIDISDYRIWEDPATKAADEEFMNAKETA